MTEFIFQLEDDEVITIDAPTQEAAQAGLKNTLARRAEPKFQADRDVMRGGQGLANAPVDTAVSSLIKGIQQTGFNAVELGLLGARALADQPETLAMLNKYDSALDKARSQIFEEERQWLRKVSPEAQFNPLIEIIGETIPLLKLMPNPSTYTRALASNTGMGSLFAGLSAAENADDIGDVFGAMPVGALIGFGASTLLIGTGITSFAGRQVVKELNKPLANEILALESKVQNMTGNPEFFFNIGQIGQQNPWLVGLQKGTAGELSLLAQNQRTQTLVDNLETRASRFNDPELLVNDLSQTIVRVSTRLHKTSQRNYGKQTEAILAQYGDDIIIPRQKAKSYLAAAQDIRGEMQDPRMFGSAISQLDHHVSFIDGRINPYKIVTVNKVGKKPGRQDVVHKETGDIKETYKFKDIDAAENARNSLNAAEGGLNAEDVKLILEGHRRLMSGEVLLGDTSVAGSANNVAQYLNTKLINAMRGTGGGAVKGIQAARDSYKYDLTNIQKFKTSTLGKIFGPKNADTVTSDPQAALAMLTRRSQPSLQRTRRILQEVAPDELTTLKGQVIRNILTEARSPAPAAFNEVGVVNLVRTLEGIGDKSNVGRRGLGLFTPGEQQELITTAKALRVLMADAKRVAEQDAPGVVADFTINLISRSAEFAGRFVVRIMSRGNSLERLLTDPGARRNLIALASKGPNRGPVKAAIAFLAVWQGRVEAEQNKELRKQIEEQQRQFPEQRR